MMFLSLYPFVMPISGTSSYVVSFGGVALKFSPSSQESILHAPARRLGDVRLKRYSAKIHARRNAVDLYILVFQ